MFVIAVVYVNKLLSIGNLVLMWVWTSRLYKPQAPEQTLAVITLIDQVWFQMHEPVITNSLKLCFHLTPSP